VMATEKLPEGEITSTASISYMNTMDDTKTRQTQQKTIWFFSCICSLCQNTKLDMQKNSIKCSQCKVARPVDIDKWKVCGPCGNCSFRRKTEDKKQVARYRELCHLLAENEPGDDDGSKKVYDDLCEWCVGEMEGVFSTGDIMYVNTLQHVHTACINKKRWDSAIDYGETALPAVRMYYGGKAGAVASLLFSLGIAYGEIGKLEIAMEYFQEADSIFIVVPGVKHPFYVDYFKPLFSKFVNN